MLESYRHAGRRHAGRPGPSSAVSTSAAASCKRSGSHPNPASHDRTSGPDSGSRPGARWFRPGLVAALVAAFLVSLAPPPVEAASLRPSRPGLLRQVRAAQAHGAFYARNEADLRTMRQTGELVRLTGDRNHVLKYSVPYPYARPEVKLFLERLSKQYKGACGKNLVVTSLVRPKNKQPRNSSPLSVHPTGMAMDLRVSSYPRCRSWLEKALLSLERRGLVEAARERYPPHYHVVLFPDPYLDFVAQKEGEAAVADHRPRSEMATGETVTYRVRRGDSLWSIARRYDTTIRSIQSVNGMSSTRIRPGQVLRVPVGMESVLTTYRVRRGDTLSGIARRHGTSTRAIRQVNGLASDTIRVGQELQIPAGRIDSRGVPGATLATYRVRSGDNLWEIARRHGTTPRSIQRANDLPSSRIKPGQVLKIPTDSR